jgi:oligoribonuclease NrnB/cAMP/cGMP phosphodiesterase (DHH superfamily)
VQQCNYIEEQIDKLHNFKPNTHIEVLLLDHHGSGKDAAAQFAWYTLDTSRSATKITYDWLTRTVGCQAVAPYARLVEAIDAIDIWQTDKEGFEFGKVLMGAIAGSRELGRALFDDEDRAHKFHLIETAQALIDEPHNHIALDDRMHAIKKGFFSQNRPDDTLDNLVAAFVTDLLTRNKEALRIEYKGHPGILTYGLPNISVGGNAFLVVNPDIDFILNVGNNGSISLRSNNAVDVSEIAATLAGGGGHPNASGGRIANFKEAYSYADVKLAIESLINEKTKES